MTLFKQILVRIIFLPLILAAGIAATAITAARFLVTPEDLRSVVVDQFQQLLRRPVSIEWAKISPTGEIQIKGLRVTEPGPEAIDFITAEYIYAGVRLLPLLRRKVELGSIVLISPKIELIKNKDGLWNVGDFFAGYRKTGKKHSLNRIMSAEIKDGQLLVIDRTKNKRYSFEGFTLDLKDLRPSEDTSFETSMFMNIDALKKPVKGRLYAEGTVNFAAFDWPRAELKNLKGDLSLLDKHAAFSGSIRNFRRPEIALKVQTQEFKSAELAYLLPAGHPFSAPGINWDLNVNFVSTRAVSVALAGRPLGLRAEGRYDFSSSTPVYNFVVSAQPLSLGLLSRYTQLPTVNSTGRLQPRITITSRNGAPVVSRLFATLSRSDFSFRTLGVTGLDLTAMLSENFASSYITATDGRLDLGPARLTGLDLKGEISREELAFVFSGRLNKEPVKGRMAIVNPFSTQKTVYYTGYSKELPYTATKTLLFDLRKLFVTAPKKKKRVSQLEWLSTLKNSIPSGYTFFKLLYKTDHFTHEYMKADALYVSAALKNLAGTVDKINGDIAMRSGAGIFYQVDDTSEKDRIYYLFSMPLRLISKMNRMGALKFNYKLKDVPFNSMGGEYALNKGKVHIKNFYMVGRDFSVSVNGQMDLTAETMDVKIYTISGKYHTMGSLPEGLTDASGRPALAFTLKGKMASPELNMLSPKENGALIKASSERNPGIDFGRINSLIGGKK